MRVVEFLGIPGSGKSTLASHLIRDLRRANLNAMSMQQAVASAMNKGVGDRWLDPLMRVTPASVRVRMADRLFFRSRISFQSLTQFLQQYEELGITVLQAQARRAEYEIRADLVHAWLFHMFARYQLVSAALEPSTVLVLDEGFVQRSVLLLGHRFGFDDHADADRYLSSLPRPTHLIRLKVNPGVASKRLLANSRRPTRRLKENDNYNDNMRFLNDADSCGTYVINQARTSGWSISELDASDDLDGLLRSTSAEVVELLR